MSGSRTPTGIRNWVLVSPAFNRELDRWAKRLGMSKSALINLCAQAGLSQIKRTISPEEAFNASKWAAITLELSKQTGVPLKLPSGDRSDDHK